MFSVLGDFDKNRVERFRQATEEKLRGVRCPDHNQPPRVRFHGDSLRNMNVSLAGCCEKLMRIANERIACAEPASADQSARASSLRKPA